MDKTNGLATLEAQIALDLQYLNIPSNNWSLSQNQLSEYRVDVAIIGAGMSGVTAAFALTLLGIEAVVFDQSVEGMEGPWQSPALMETLRSPKQVVGPALASPSLTFQAWFKAQFGDEQWDALDKIPRLQWGEYLQWFKTMTAPNVLNQHRLIDTELTPHGTQLTFQTHNGEQQYHALHVILATGMESFSEVNIPRFMDNIPKTYWEHSYAGSDYHRFKDKDLAVIGYSAGAMDSLATALEHGARSVELLIRADDMPRVNRGKVAGSAGFTQAYGLMTDAQKWHYSDYVMKAKTPAPHGSTLRVSRHQNAHFNFSTQVKHVEVTNNKLHIATTTADFILLF